MYLELLSACLNLLGNVLLHATDCSLLHLLPLALPRCNNQSAGLLLSVRLTPSVTYCLYLLSFFAFRLWIFTA